MNLLGIDYGKKRIGLAWMQDGLDVVLPFGTISNEQRTTNNEQLLRTIKEEKIDKVVIGFPLKNDGEDTDSTDDVRAFVENLQKELHIPIEIIDERFTTAQAKQMGGEASLDEKAAMLILQSYLERS